MSRQRRAASIEADGRIALCNEYRSSNTADIVSGNVQSLIKHDNKAYFSTVKKDKADLVKTNGVTHHPRGSQYHYDRGYG